MSLSPAQASAFGKLGGRPRGRAADVATKASAVRALEIIKTGNAPADVMLRNMWHWDAKAQDLTVKFEAALADIDFSDPDSIKEAHSLFRAMMAARDKSQSCAVDLAPYVHARLATITVKPEDGATEMTLKRIERVLVDHLSPNDKTAEPSTEQTT